MHQVKVLILGPASFSTTLNELKPFLKFNSTFKKSSSAFDIILFHEDALNDVEDNKIINASHSLKVYASNKKNTLNNFDAFLELPSSLQEINAIIESVTANLVKIRQLRLKITY